jgi:DNA modification methylase
MTDIKPDQHNANKGTKRGKELLKQSLTELGGGRSILLDKDGNIIAGNKTFEAAQDAGMKVRIVEAGRDELVAIQRTDLNLNDQTGEARRLAYLDNRVAELDLNWDPDQLANDSAAGLNFENMGFLEGELRQMLEQAGIGDEAGKDPGDQSEKGDELIGKWGVEIGQVWTIGNHRLICGDATNMGDVDRLMRTDKAALTFTSPPYWVGMKYETQKSEDEIAHFIQDTCGVIDAATRRDSSRVVINTGTGFTTAFDKKSKRHVLLLIDQWTNALRARGWNLRHVRHWLKEGQVMATAPRADMIDQHCEFLGSYENADGQPMRYEDMLREDDVNTLLAFYHKQGKQRGQEWTGTTWALRAYWDDIKGNARATGHEAAFPLELPIRHLMLYTKRGEVVFEPFCGSGTTLVACEIMGRICHASELLPKYVAATLERWHLLTGKNPVMENV